MFPNTGAHTIQGLFYYSRTCLGPPFITAMRRQSRKPRWRWRVTQFERRMKLLWRPADLLSTGDSNGALTIKRQVVEAPQKLSLWTFSHCATDFHLYYLRGGSRDVEETTQNVNFLVYMQKVPCKHGGGCFSLQWFPMSYCSQCLLVFPMGSIISNMLSNDVYHNFQSIRALRFSHALNTATLTMTRLIFGWLRTASWRWGQHKLGGDHSNHRPL